MELEGVKAETSNLVTLFDIFLCAFVKHMLNNYFPVNDPVLGVYSGILHSNHSPLVRRRIGLAGLPLLYSTKQEWWQA